MEVVWLPFAIDEIHHTGLALYGSDFGSRRALAVVCFQDDGSWVGTIRP